MSHSRLLDATRFAAERHRHQRRKDVTSTPYINHLIEVAEVLASVGDVTDINVLIGAILHDTVEDTETTIEELKVHFGWTVAGYVAEVTDDKTLAKQRRKELQVELAPHKSDEARQIKLADKICNIRDIDNESPVGWDRDRKIEYLNWANRVVAGCRGVNDPLEQLFDQVVAEARRRVGS